MRSIISTTVSAAALACAGLFSLSATAAATPLGVVTATTPFIAATVDGNFQDLYTFSVVPNAGTVMSVNSDTFASYGVVVSSILLYAGNFTTVAQLLGETALGTSNGVTQSDLGNGIFSHTVSAATLDLTPGNIYTMAVAGVSQGTSAYTGIVALIPVPEPEAYAMLLAGMGIVAAIARRKKPRTRTTVRH